MFPVEGIMRGPRLWSNRELRKYAHLFKGDIINVSGANDSDKSIANPLRYLFTCDFDAGVPYKSYFTAASSYTISNFEPDNRRGFTAPGLDLSHHIPLDLNKPLDKNLQGRFDVVFNHTVLEHVFDIFSAFRNLCDLSRDIVILVVPFVQMVHDYHGAYRDYWRFTPFAIDELFRQNSFTILYQSSSNLFNGSIYHFYIASRKPDEWRKKNLFLASNEIKKMNLGGMVFPFAQVHLRVESLLRKFGILFLRSKKDSEKSVLPEMKEKGGDC
jgi:hypothetical protein